MIIMEKTRYVQQAAAFSPAPSHAELIACGYGEKNRDERDQ